MSRELECEVTCPALVLSGGGVRGAYEVGVVCGIVEALRLGPNDPPPFRIFAGTSVGAINATFLAAHTARGDLGVDRLAEIWRSLDIHEHLRLDPLGLFGRRLRPKREAGLGRSVLSPKPLEELVERSLPWDALHEAVSTGKTHAVIVAALEVGSGRTTMFAELSPQASFRPSRDPRRTSRVQPLTANHVLASAALPLVFPARRVGTRYYVDGGLRFNTPIAPAIRVGATRMVVVSLRHEEEPGEEQIDHTEDYPSIAFLAGKLLNALLLDPVSYDLQILARFNRLLDILYEALTPEEMARVERAMIENRGAPYRPIDVLAFKPSRDIGAVAAEHVARGLTRWRLGPIGSWVLRVATRSRAGRDSDLASYILFDGGFADELIRLGRHDALVRADEIRAFFAAKPRA